MRTSRIVLNLAIVAAAVFLSGCYVTSQKLPAGALRIDERLIGAWQALDEDGKPEKDATFLHFVKTADHSPLVLVLIDTRTATNYEMNTIQVGSRTLFAVKPLSSTAPSEKPETGFILGYYDVRGDDLYLSLLDTKKVKDLIDAGKLQGTADSGNYGKVTLTGSPRDLADFFARTDPKSISAGERPAHARRVNTANQ